MNFRTMTVKECFDNAQCAAIIKAKAPNLTKYPIKLFNKKTCGEIFDLVVSKKRLFRRMSPKRSKPKSASFNAIKSEPLPIEAAVFSKS